MSRVTKSKGEREAPFDLPVNWKWVQLGQVSELINGDRSKNYPNKAEYFPEGVAWINTGHIEPDGTLSTERMHFITRQKFDSLRSGKVRPGDLVYCLRGATFGKTAIITQFEEGAVASSLVIIRLAKAVDPKLAYRFLTSPLGREQIFEFDDDSAQPNLSASNVKKYWVPIPTFAVQRRIMAKVEQLIALVDGLETQLPPPAPPPRTSSPPSSPNSPSNHNDKNPSFLMNTDPTLAELQRELAALRERVATLETKCAAGGGAITCSSLTVVDSHNNPVAAIDAAGDFQCRRIVVGKPGAGTWLDYDPTFGELVIFALDPAGGAPVKLVALNENRLGRIALKAPMHHHTQAFVRLSPDAMGGRIELGDAAGKTICDVNTSSAGSTWFLKSKDPQQGSVTLRVDGSGSGQIVVRDAVGTLSAKLP